MIKKIFDLLKRVSNSLQFKLIAFLTFCVAAIPFVIELLINPFRISHFNLYSYQAFAVIINIVVSSMGLAGGYLYFKYKNDEEKTNLIRNNKRQKVEYILTVLNRYDEKVCDYILQANAHEKNAMIHHTFGIMKHNFLYTRLLENFSEIFEFDDTDLKKIVAIQSFVEENVLNHPDLIKNQQKILYDYTEIFQEGLSPFISRLK